MKQRLVGPGGLPVSAVGLGCMGFSQAYGPADDSESVATLHAALDLGVTLLDTAMSYGSGHLDGRPGRVRAFCEASLARLRVDYLDLYYLHRVDPRVPVEETVGAMADLVTAGKVGQLGISEASADQLACAVATHPISALQCEWSLFWREPEDDVVPAARRLGVAWCPTARSGAACSPAHCRRAGLPAVTSGPATRASMARTWRATWRWPRP